MTPCTPAASPRRNRRHHPPLPPHRPCPDGNSGDFQILLNLGPEPAVTHCAPGEVVLTTLLDGEGARTGNPDTNTPAPITLEAGEGLLVALD
jgi:hypothetical protein